MKGFQPCDCGSSGVRATSVAEGDLHSTQRLGVPTVSHLEVIHFVRDALSGN
jgi:hypothetical protein